MDSTELSLFVSILLQCDSEVDEKVVLLSAKIASNNKESIPYSFISLLQSTGTKI